MEGTHPKAVTNVALALVIWSLFAIGMSLLYVLDGRPAAWAGIGVGALTLAIAWIGKRRGRWLEPLFAAHYLLAFGCIVAGPIADVDEYVVGGILAITVLSVGLSLLLRLEENRGARAS